MITNVCVDGFNLYYGCLKGSQHKWLNLEALCRHLLPAHEIKRIRCFTAMVAARDDPQAPVRQNTYVRALETLDKVSIHYGHFLTQTTRMTLAQPPAAGPKTIEVIKTEEKGSDVNVATHLVANAFRHDADAFRPRGLTGSSAEGCPVGRHGPWARLVLAMAS